VVCFLVVVGAALAVPVLWLRARRLSFTAEASEALQTENLRKRWEALGPNRATYLAHCSSVGTARPLTKEKPDDLKAL